MIKSLCSELVEFICSETKVRNKKHEPLVSSVSCLKLIGQKLPYVKSYHRSLAGSLHQGRHGHGVILNGEEFVVVGGYSGTFKTEYCMISGETVTCTQHRPGLTGYMFYPELALVDDNYGNDC